MISNVLLLDNNDSFTYNIVDLIHKIDDVNLSIIETDKIKIEEIEGYSKIIISPGPGLPDDFPNLFKIINAYVSKIPILGICLGHQAIANYFGVQLKQISPVVHGQAHIVNIIQPSPLFESIPLRFKVGLYHSWTVDSNNLPDDIKITSVSDSNIIMSLESKSNNVFGVQFHPESHLTEFGLQIINNFIELKNNY